MTNLSDREIARALRMKADALEAETRAKVQNWRRTAYELDPLDDGLDAHPTGPVPRLAPHRLTPPGLAPPLRRRDPSVLGRIVELFNANRDREYDAQQVLDSLIAAGWEPSAADPLNSLRTSLGRLHDRGQIRRVRKGWYQALEESSPNPSSFNGPEPHYNGSEPDNHVEERPFVAS